jgi:hypothetical protein
MKPDHRWLAKELQTLEEAEARGEVIPMAYYYRLRRRWFDGMGHHALISPVWKGQWKKPPLTPACDTGIV